MPYARSKADRNKAVALVLLVHAALALAVLAGPGEPVTPRLAERLRTFDVTQDVPPGPALEPSRESAAPDDAGAPALESRPSPIVAPPPAVRLPSPDDMAVADEATHVDGTDRTAGAAGQPGIGQGAGGTGSGFGGGSSGGDGAGGLGVGARLLSGNLTRRDYRHIRSFGSPAGRAVLEIEVGPDGRLTACAPLVGSGSPDLDDELCALLSRTRWSPALDRSGRPVSVSLRYVATWDRD